MTGVRRLVKSHRLFNSLGISAALPILAISFVAVCLITCIVNTAIIIDYLKKGFPFSFSSYVMFIFCTFSFSSTLISNFINANVKNHNTFLIQLPVSKKTLFNFKFFIVMLGTMIIHVQMVYYLLLNYLTGSNAYITAYIGFSVAVHCLWFIALSTAIGFSNLSSAKFQFSNCFSTVMGVLITVVIVWSLATNKPAMTQRYNMYNVLGKGLAPVIKATDVFGGFGGLLLLAASIAMGYYFCVTLPLKISEREG